MVYSILMYILQIPNGFGCVLGSIQLILYGIYRKNKEGEKKPTADGNYMEMGVAKNGQT